MTNSRPDYPAQDGYYRVKVKNGAGWRFFKTARLQISVGQPYHEDEKMKATFEWVKHRFDKVIICVNDTLQRHNYCFGEGLTDKRATAKADTEGQNWILRHAEEIKQLPNFEVWRWDNWRRRKDYQNQLQHAQKLYRDQKDVHELLDANIKEFWERLCQRDPEMDQSCFEDFAKHSRNYLIEEIAVFFLMFKEQKAVDIYPGSVLLPCVLAQDYSDHAAPDYLGQRAFTRIDFSVNDNYGRKKKHA